METIKIGRKNFTNLVDVNVKGSKVVNGVRYYTYGQAQKAVEKFNSLYGEKHTYEIPTAAELEKAYFTLHKNGIRGDESEWGKPGGFGCAAMHTPNGIKLLGKITFNANRLVLRCSDDTKFDNVQKCLSIPDGDNCPCIFGEVPSEFMLPLVLIQK